MTVLIDGKKIAETIREEIASKVEDLSKQRGVFPCLAAVLVGEDPASQVYVRNKERACEKAGMKSRLFRLPHATTTEKLLDLLQQLNQDRTIHGVLVQLPLPQQIDARRVLDAVHPARTSTLFPPKTLDSSAKGDHAICPAHRTASSDFGSFGIGNARKARGGSGTKRHRGQTSCHDARSKGRSCGEAFANATVTCCHSQTPDLAEYTRQADILIVAIGRPQAITGDMIRPGAVVIDVGINRLGDQLVGDVDFPTASQVASAITPVPGGVGHSPSPCSSKTP